MSDPSFPFQHFPLDHPEYYEQVWLLQRPASTLSALLKQPHDWIRTHIPDRAPEQLLGIRQDALTIQFLYPADGPAKETLLIAGPLGRNLLTIYMPHSSGLTEADFVTPQSERPQELKVTVYGGIAFCCHYPFPGAGRDEHMDYVARVIQSPARYLAFLNNETYWRLVPAWPYGGYVAKSSPSLPGRVRLNLPENHLSGLRFLFQWNADGSQSSGSYAESNAEPVPIKLTGTYDEDAQEELLPLKVDTLAHLEAHTPPPPPPGTNMPTAPPGLGKPPEAPKKGPKGKKA